MHAKHFSLALLCSVMCTVALAQKNKNAPPAPPVADTAKKSAAKSPKPTIEDKTKSSKENEGLFAVYQDTATGSVQLYIRKDQLGKEYIVAHSP